MNIKGFHKNSFSPVLPSICMYFHKSSYCGFQFHKTLQMLPFSQYPSHQTFGHSAKFCQLKIRLCRFIIIFFLITLLINWATPMTALKIEFVKLRKTYFLFHLMSFHDHIWFVFIYFFNFVTKHKNLSLFLTK